MAGESIADRAVIAGAVSRLPGLHPSLRRTESVMRAIARSLIVIPNGDL
jgi:hypothetical protein